ncbi:hypothetical protein ONZ43_g2579 [Nemania bipapillata]|uniref:Uncharacterized protein n=1 Tax=Nemania bipapillata TaxID=110536 RepID=A0ACC2J0A1_9PEZI|nr:hypothetical protein ONZ43_g2579 [Nemania bipapillata]
MGFIERDNFDCYIATQLGKAVVASSLEPEDGAFVHREMQRALKAFVMDGEMHILYTFTPVQELSVSVNWQVFRSEMEALDDSGMRVMLFLGLKPVVVNRMAQGGNLKESTPAEKETARIYRRFYLALQLRDLCNEMPVHAVALKAMAAILDHFSDRLKAGAKADLLALAKVTFIKSRTARVFYDNGFKTVALLANADPRELVPILMQAQPTKLRNKSKDEQKYEEKLLAKAQVITDSANRLWQSEMRQDLEEE